MKLPTLISVPVADGMKLISPILTILVVIYLFLYIPKMHLTLHLIHPGVILLHNLIVAV